MSATKPERDYTNQKEIIQVQMSAANRCTSSLLLLHRHIHIHARAQMSAANRCTSSLFLLLLLYGMRANDARGKQIVFIMQHVKMGQQQRYQVL